jgi:phosphonate degradation associated HDIG domain protein
VTTPPATSVAEVLALYERWGGDRYDEEISQREHALQTAALAVAAGADDALVVAALLHDVGHLLDLEQRNVTGADGVTVDLRHEATGARYLAGLFPPAVTGPIALHVRAKRYRCTVDGAYLTTLSAGSTRSLQRQGGLLTPDDVASFEANPGCDDAVALREWDDSGKVEGLAVPSLEDYVSLLDRLAMPAR